MNKIILFINILLFILPQVNGQSVIEGIYIKKSTDEFICLKKDTVSFRLLNNDGFGSYTFFYGTYELKQHTLKLGENLIEKFTTNLEETTGIDSIIQIQLFYNDSTPMKFAQVKIYMEKKRCRIVYKQSDHNGQLHLRTEEISDLLNSPVTIKVQILGFNTKQSFVLKIGKKYILKSKIYNDYPFTMTLIKNKYNLKTESQILKIYWLLGKEIVLNRINEKYESCKMLLFTPYFED